MALLHNWRERRRMPLILYSDWLRNSHLILRVVAAPEIDKDSSSAGRPSGGGRIGANGLHVSSAPESQASERCFNAGFATAVNTSSNRLGI